MKKIVYWTAVVIGLAIASAIGKGVGKSLVEPSKPSQSEVNRQISAGLQEAASRSNASLPKMIDEHTRYDRMVAGPGLQVTYLYTMPYIASSEIDRKEFAQLIRPNIVSKICSDETTRKMLFLGVSTVMKYSSADGVPIAEIYVDKSSCN